MFVSCLIGGLQVKSFRPPGWDSALFLPDAPHSLSSQVGHGTTLGPCDRRQSHIDWAAMQTLVSSPSWPWPCPVRLLPSMPRSPAFLPSRCGRVRMLLAHWLWGTDPEAGISVQEVSCGGGEELLALTLGERKGRKQIWVEGELGL